jgi:hypothetical protein
MVDILREVKSLVAKQQAPDTQSEALQQLQQLTQDMIAKMRAPGAPAQSPGGAPPTAYVPPVEQGSG